MAIPDFTYHGKLDGAIAFDPGNNLEISIEQADTEGERTVTITLRDFLTGMVYGYTGSMDVAEEGISDLMLEDIEAAPLYGGETLGLDVMEEAPELMKSEPVKMDKKVMEVEADE